MSLANTLLCSFSVLAVVMSSGCGTKDDSAVRPALAATGALLTPGAKDKPVENVNLSLITDAKKLDEAIALLPQLSVVKTIDAQGSPILKDAHLEPIGKIKTMIALTLNRTPITDAGIAHLAGARKLFSLSMFDTEITDAGLAAIGKIKSLHILNIGKTKVTGDMSQITGLENLEWLVASDLNLPESAADAIGSLPKLTHLQISNSQLSEAALEKIRKARKEILIE